MYMFTAMDRIRLRSADVLREAPGVAPAAQSRMLAALHQILDIELAIMLETYRDDLLTKNRTAERLATIGQFAAGIGHELRNPLGVVESSAYLVTRRLEQLQVRGSRGDPAHGEDHHRGPEIRKDDQRPPGARAEQAAQAPHRRLPRSSCWTPFQPRTSPTPSRWSSRSRTACPSMPIPTSSRELSPTFCINASQAMNAKGHIWIDARREGAATVIRVRDDGPGIPSNLREQIFEALFTTKAKGSGLGLALCRRIAEAHGGTVAFEPSEQGAVFRIVVPDSSTAAAAS